MLLSFAEMSPEQLRLAGGKGASLAQMTQAGLPVPPGFVVLEEAFDAEDRLRDGARERIVRALSKVRAHEAAKIAVRSSAMAEDSAHASFAGGFESELGLVDEASVLAAIERVRRSRHGERAKVYGESRGVSGEHSMAVVVQRQVDARWAGVLFTACPISGDRRKMVVEYVEGLGDRLVSGEVDPERFEIRRPGGEVDGAPSMRALGRRLHALAEAAEELFDAPQDIEWAAAKDGRVYLLQSRPVSTCSHYDPVHSTWNGTRTGDFLWTATNAGEAVPNVMTPASWSIIESTQGDMVPFRLPGGYPLLANLWGRLYLNYSFGLSLRVASGVTVAAAKAQLEDTLGIVPPDIDVPLLPVAKRHIFRHVLPGVLRTELRKRRELRELDAFLADGPARARALLARIDATEDRRALSAMWPEVFAITRRVGFLVSHVTAEFMDRVTELRAELVSRVGAEDAHAIVAAFSARGGELESLGPSVGLARVRRGTVSREEFLERYGHRCVDEAELSIPRPIEDPGFFDRVLATHDATLEDAEALLAKQIERSDAAIARLRRSHPVYFALSARRRLALAALRCRQREQVRSELIRANLVARRLFLRAGRLLALDGDDVFFLTYQECREALEGGALPLDRIAARKAVHAKLLALPRYPSLIRGRFDAFAWAAAGAPGADFFDARPAAPVRPAEDARVLRGFAGAAGVVEGPVRKLSDPSELAKLQPGDVLVAVTTNVGWTPLFPRVKAVVTDVGAPLSHAAIVARELGIPAVVGCRVATRLLEDGERVRVDGTAGTVERLSPLEPPSSTQAPSQRAAAPEDPLPA